MILAVADDISGAAEIAAVGRRFGLTAQVHMKAAGNASADLVVVDTDSRYKSGNPARDIEQALACDRNVAEWYYKKVDSVLRGNVSAELHAMMQILKKNSSILNYLNENRGANCAPASSIRDFTLICPA